MSKKQVGDLIIIGGHESKEDDGLILDEIVKRVNRRAGHLLIVTIATQHPEEVAAAYTRLFQERGCREIEVLDSTRSGNVSNGTAGAAGGSWTMIDGSISHQRFSSAINLYMSWIGSTKFHAPRHPNRVLLD